MTPSSMMEARAAKRRENARKAREYAARYVAMKDRPRHDPRAIRLDLTERATEAGVDRTILWIAVRDELRRAKEW